LKAELTKMPRSGFLTALKPSSSMLTYPPKGINKFTAVNLAALSSNPLRAILS
jgi:hypothetical protein